MSGLPAAPADVAPGSVRAAAEGGSYYVAGLAFAAAAPGVIRRRKYVIA